MSFTKHIFIYVSWQISVKCIFILGGGNISYIRKHFEKQIVAIFCCICCNVWHRIPGPRQSRWLRLLIERSAGRRRKSTEKWSSVTCIVPWENYLFSFKLKLDCGSYVYLFQYDRNPYWFDHMKCELFIFNIFYLETVLRYSTKL